MKAKNMRSGVLGGTDQLTGKIETYPLNSVKAAGKMASKSGNNDKERADYSRILMQESRDLASYIINKRA